MCVCDVVWYPLSPLSAALTVYKSDLKWVATMLYYNHLHSLLAVNMRTICGQAVLYLSPGHGLLELPMLILFWDLPIQTECTLRSHGNRLLGVISIYNNFLVVTLKRLHNQCRCCMFRIVQILILGLVKLVDYKKLCGMFYMQILYAVVSLVRR
jgi:hypothetical protein